MCKEETVMLKKCDVCEAYVCAGSCDWGSQADAYKKIYTVFGCGAARRTVTHLMGGNDRRRRGKHAAK